MSGDGNLAPTLQVRVREKTGSIFSNAFQMEMVGEDEGKDGTEKERHLM